MKKTVDPGTFNLPPKTVIEEVSRNHFAIVISRKSRIIMADGKKLIQKAEAIRKVRPHARLSVKIVSAPLCSKTKTFLEDHNIGIL